MRPCSAHLRALSPPHPRPHPHSLTQPHFSPSRSQPVLLTRRSFNNPRIDSSLTHHPHSFELPPSRRHEVLCRPLCRRPLRVVGRRSRPDRSAPVAPPSRCRASPPSCQACVPLPSLARVAPGRTDPPSSLRRGPPRSTRSDACARSISVGLWRRMLTLCASLCACLWALACAWRRTAGCEHALPFLARSKVNQRVTDFGTLPPPAPSYSRCRDALDRVDGCCRDHRHLVGRGRLGRCLRLDHRVRPAASEPAASCTRLLTSHHAHSNDKLQVGLPLSIYTDADAKSRFAAPRPTRPTRPRAPA